MKIYSNFEKYSPSEKYSSDQLICVVKGSLEMLMVNQTFLEKLSSENATHEENFLNTIEMTKPILEPGHCLYIPKSWAYSLKTNYAWFYTISWKSFQRYVQETECFDREQPKNQTKLSNLEFSWDNTFLNSQEHLKIDFIVYFLKYINSTSSLSKTDFIETLLKDEKVVGTIKNCDENCQDIFKKLFDILDIDGDEKFSADDFLSLDEQSFTEKSSKAHMLTAKLEKLVQDQLGNLKKTLEDLKNLGKKNGNMQQIVELLKEKLGEWFKNLSDEERAKYGGLDINTLVDQLMHVEEVEPDEKKERPKKNNVETNTSHHKTDSNYEDKNDINESFLIVEDEEINEIEADDDSSEIKGKSEL